MLYRGGEGTSWRTISPRITRSSRKLTASFPVHSRASNLTEPKGTQTIIKVDQKNRIIWRCAPQTNLRQEDKMIENEQDYCNLYEQFWINVAMTLAKRRRSFSWLEREAGLPFNLARSARSKGTRVRLAMALRIAKTLEVGIDDLLFGKYELSHAEGGQK